MKNILDSLFTYYSFSIPKQEIEQKIMGHYAYPSLLSLKEGLENLGFKTMPINIPKERLAQVNYPCVAHLKKGDFILLQQYNSNEVIYLTENKKKIKESITDFEKKWSGALLLISPNEETLKKYKTNVSSFFSKSLLIKLLSVICMAFLVFQMYQVTIIVGLLVLLKIAGILVSVPLLQFQIGDGSSVEKLCKVNKDVDCESVLDSSASKINDWLSWSDMGLFYFGGGFFTLFLASFGRFELLNFLPYFAILSALSLPYSFFSVYYQWKVVKKWCLFCLMIQVLFWIEFLLLFNFVILFRFDWYVLSMIGFGFSFPFLLWLFLKDELKKATNLIHWKIRALRLENNPIIFQKVLTSNPKLIENENKNYIEIGNLNATTQVTIFTNLYCAPCAKLHHKLINLMSKTDICLRLCFVSFEGKENTTHYFLSLYKQYTHEIFENILNEWYADKEKNIKNFEKKYPVKNNRNARYGKKYATFISNKPNKPNTYYFCAGLFIA